MKRLLKLSLVLCGLFLTANAYSQSCYSQQETTSEGIVYTDNNFANSYVADNGGAPCDQPVNDCWCRYVHWQPVYYQTQRCVEEQVPCQKNCCRMVPKYFQVQRCKYVPEYYSETYCRYEPEYYCVPDCRTVTRTVCDTHCKYVPQYYWKHTCGETSCQAQCPQGY